LFFLTNLRHSICEIKCCSMLKKKGIFSFSYFSFDVVVE
jgi:hypothetical protein